MKKTQNSLASFLRFLLVSLGILFFLIKCGDKVLHYAKDIYGPKTQDPRNYNLNSFGIYIPSQYKTHGIDVSHYQGLIDWKEVANMEIDGVRFRFVFIKATEGKEKKDDKFAYNWSESKKHKLLRGAYHFYRPNINSQYQADNFIETVTLGSGDLPPVVDIEITGKYSMKNTRQGVKNWLRIVEAHYGVKPIIYTNANYYTKHLKGHFKEYPLWIARYQQRDLNLENRDWIFWQHSDQGLVNGIAGPVDFNVFNGSYQELKKKCKK